MLYSIYEFWKEALDAERAAGEEGWAHSMSFLNIFGYVVFRAIVAFLLSFGIVLTVAPKVIRKLISLKVGQPIRTAEEVHKLHELHGAKAGTPTMGGVMILGAVLISVLIASDFLNPFVAVTMCVMLALGLLGFVDDYAKVVMKTSDGVSGKTKLFWQFFVGAAAACFLIFKPEAASYLFVGQEIPITNLLTPVTKEWMLPLGLFAIPFFIFVIMGSSNAVNLTDGLDGLAIGCTITVSLTFAVISYISGHAFISDYLHMPHNTALAELSIVMTALAGAGFGFLWFNCHPASVFMGDTGSLAIGGCIGMTAICVRQELLLVLVGGIFVMEALSVMIQVFSFKTTGKRVFRMSPIHHHFELGGWKEGQVIVRFWTLSIIFALIGLAILKIV